MAATFVKVTKLQNGSGTVASGSVTATAGNALVACVGFYYETSTAQNPTLVVTGGGTWVTAGKFDHHFSANDNLCEAFASCLSATGGAQTITLTWTVTGSPPTTIQTAWIYEFSGMATSSMLDALGTGANGTTSPITTTAQTNANATDVMFACAHTLSASNETHGSPANSWTMPTGADETNVSFLTGVSAYKIVAASASQSTSWTDSPAPSGGYSSFQAAFKQGAGATTFPLTVSCSQATSVSVGRATTLRRTVTTSEATAVSIASAPKLNFPITRSVTQATAPALAQGLVLHRTLGATQATSATVAIRRDVKNTATVTTSVTTAVLLGTSSVNLPSNYYTTVFPVAENPVNEGGVWSIGGRDGLDWTSPRTVTNQIFGVQSGTDSPPYTDSIAVIKGTFGPDQEATATVFSTLGNGGYYCEVELLLRFTIGPHATTGYEVTLNVNPVNSYLQVNRWNGLGGGSLSNYTQLVSVGGVVANGDVVKATIVGSTIRLFVNGTQALTVNDSTYTTGNPGVGFYNENNGGHADPSTFGFTRFTAHTIGAPIPLSRSITQGTSAALARKQFLTRALTQAHSATLRQQGFLRRLLSVGEAVSLTRGSSAIAQTVSAIAQTVVSLQVRQVHVLPLSVVQATSAVLLKQARLVHTLPQVATALLQKQARSVRAIVQGTLPSISSGPTTVYALVVVTSERVSASGQFAPPIPPIPPEPLPPFPFQDAPLLEPATEPSAPALGPGPVAGAPSLLPVP